MRKIILIAVLGLFTALSAEDSPPEPEIVSITVEQANNRGIELQKAQEGMLNLGLIRRGKVTIHPDHVAFVIPQVSGVVLEAKKNIGDSAKAGEVLALLQSKDLAEIEANYLQALNKLEATSALYSRENVLHQKQLNSEEDFINSQAAFKEANLNTQILNQKMRALGMTEEDIANLPNQNVCTLGVYALHAPISGKVLERNLSKGQYLDGNPQVYTLADLTTVWVEIGIYPKDAATVKPGQKIVIEHPHTKEPVTAHMVTINPLIEEDTILSKVIAEIDNSSGDWLPGSFVNATLITETPKVPIAIPISAIQNIDGDDYVFVMTPKGFEKRNVTLGRKDDTKVEVVSGLVAGETIPINKTFLFKAELGKSTIEPDDD